MQKILFTTSTLPASDTDPVPSFVKDQAIWLSKKCPGLKIDILAPHNSYSKTKKHIDHSYYGEYRFHYFWPFRYELLTGRGIMPALKQNKLLYLQIPFLIFFQFFALLRLTRKQKPNLIYAHWFTPQGITAAMVGKLTRTPLMFTTHASDVSVLAKLPFASAIVRNICARAEAFTAVSERTANKLKIFFSKEEWAALENKFSIIPMGVDTNLPKISKIEIEQTREQYGIPADNKYVLFIGRLAEKKGVSYLLEAWSLLPEIIAAQSHLVIAGDGQLSEQLKTQVKNLKLKNVTFTGYIQGKDKTALLELADYICLPSIVDSSGDSEGFPVVLMEGLAYGKIVLASNTTGGETIIKNGENGFVFPEKSVVPLKDTLIKALSLDKKELVKIAERAEELSKEYGWDSITDRHYKIIDKAINENTDNK